MLRPRPDLGARLLVVRSVALDEAGLKCFDDHRRRFVEAGARLVHADPERFELAPRQPAARSLRCASWVASALARASASSFADVDDDPDVDDDDYSPYPVSEAEMMTRATAENEALYDGHNSSNSAE